MKNKPEYLIIHHSGGTDFDPRADTSHHTFQIVDSWHKAKWGEKSSLGHYIGYHWFIEKDGTIKQGRADEDIGLHTIGMNSRSIGICLAGNFDFYEPTFAQMRMLGRVIAMYAGKYRIPASKIVPHRIFSTKSCYGNTLSNNWGREMLFAHWREQISYIQSVILKLQDFLKKKNMENLGGVDRGCEGQVNI